MLPTVDLYQKAGGPGREEAPAEGLTRGEDDFVRLRSKGEDGEQGDPSSDAGVLARRHLFMVIDEGKGRKV